MISDDLYYLFNCPFCNGKAYIETLDYVFESQKICESDHSVICNVCRGSSALLDNKAQAVNLWNHRVDNKTLKYEKLLAYIRLLQEVEDCEYPFCLVEREDILSPTEFLKEIGES